MTKGTVEEAERRGLRIFDDWNDVTGLFVAGNSYRGEIESVIQDAVHIGIQMALFGDVHYDEDRNPVRTRFGK